MIKDTTQMQLFVCRKMFVAFEARKGRNITVDIKIKIYFFIHIKFF